jgi:CheY-like chemotaxis protein
VDDLTPEQRRVNSQKTVLIVEDNELNMRLFHDIMEMQGYNILQTTNGMDALKLARRHRPDLIVMDIQLPEVSGIEVSRWIKEDDDLKSTPIWPSRFPSTVFLQPSRASSDRSAGHAARGISASAQVLIAPMRGTWSCR